MIENIPILLKAYNTATGTFTGFTGWLAKNKGESRAIIEELKDNSRYLWLVIEEDIPIDEIIDDLSTKEYDRLSKSGFSFKNLKRKKIPNYTSLEGTNLLSWQGKETEQLVSNIYDKIKDIKIKYPRSKDSKKTRWKPRINNTQKRILLLLKHASS